MSKDIKKALEHCVDWDCGSCPNKDELGSGETVCRGRLLPDVLEYVADLEAKLAEKDAERELDNSFWKQESDSLQKQLAEKEQENERLKEEICKYEITLMDKNSQLKKQQQDKISFAVEQLLDIKEEVFGTREMGIVFDIPPVQDAFNVIENKIKQLKREE